MRRYNEKASYVKITKEYTFTSWSSDRADKLTKMGNRPINSGMRPYAMRSELSTYNQNMTY